MLVITLSRDEDSPFSFCLKKTFHQEMTFTVKQLREQAKERGIKNFSKLNKWELEEALGVRAVPETVPEVVSEVVSEVVPEVVPDSVEEEDEGGCVERPTSVKALRDILKARGFTGISKTKKEDLYKMYDGEMEMPEKAPRGQNVFFLALAEWRKKNPTKSPIIKKGTAEYDEVRKIQEELAGSKEAMKRGKKAFS